MPICIERQTKMYPKIDKKDKKRRSYVVVGNFERRRFLKRNIFSDFDQILMMMAIRKGKMALAEAEL